METETSVTLPIFHGGDCKKFELWWRSFQAFASVKQFSEALQVGGEAYMPATFQMALDLRTTQGQRQAAAKKRNELAMKYLTMAFSSEHTMILLSRTRSKDWPNGLAHLVVESLLQKYRLPDFALLEEFRSDLNRVCMTASEHPAALFEQVYRIKRRYYIPDKNLEKDLMAVIFAASPQEYSDVLIQELRVRGNALTIGDLKAAMYEHWHQMDSAKKFHDGKGAGTYLHAVRSTLFSKRRQHIIKESKAENSDCATTPLSKIFPVSPRSSCRLFTKLNR